MARTAAGQDRADVDLEVGAPRTSAAGVPAAARGGTTSTSTSTSVVRLEPR